MKTDINPLFNVSQLEETAEENTGHMYYPGTLKAATVTKTLGQGEP